MAVAVLGRLAALLWVAGVLLPGPLCVRAHVSSLIPSNDHPQQGFQPAERPSSEQPRSEAGGDAKQASPVLPEQIVSVMAPPVTGHDAVSAADVSEMFLSSRSDLQNTLMDHIKSVASQAYSTGQAEQLMGLTSPIGLDSSAEQQDSDLMAHVSAMDSQLPTEITSPSGEKLSLTSFPQLIAQSQGSSPGGVASVPQGLERISKEFGSTISGMAAHVGRLFGPSPSYNGPCQCRACMNVVHRLRTALYENTFHYGVQEIDQELDDRFCFGERWMYRSTCYHVVGRYREMLKVLVWLGTKEFDVCAFIFQCYPTSRV